MNSCVFLSDKEKLRARIQLKKENLGQFFHEICVQRERLIRKIKGERLISGKV